MDGQAVIHPVYGKEKSRTGATIAVMAATLPDVNALADTLGLARDDYRDFFSARLYQGGSDDHGFFIVGPFIGAPHAVILLENLVVRGVDRIVFVGWCGSLSGRLSIGDVLIASGAYSDEGTARHYGVSDSQTLLETSKELDGRLASSMNHLGLPVLSAQVWTTDALYRETPEKIIHFRDQGAWAVEMELSALLAVAAFRDVALSSILLVSDSMESFTWQPGFKDPRFKIGRKNLAAIMKNFVEKMGRTDHGS
ncbi:MAG: nucleoside phosphorylase [Desulfobacteraceae bacterium]|jgi:purine-nucleoside phosphorylase